MQSAIKTNQRAIPSRVSYTLALVFVFSLAESSLPHPIPFLRLGLANIPILLSLYTLPTRELCVLVLSKTILSSLFGGTILSPVIIVSLIGNLASLLAMLILKKVHFLTALSVAPAAAIVYDAAEILAARWVLIGANITPLLPFLMTFSLFCATVCGYISLALLPSYRETVSFIDSGQRPLEKAPVSTEDKVEKGNPYTRISAVVNIVIWVGLLNIVFTQKGNVIKEVPFPSITLYITDLGIKKAIIRVLVILITLIVSRLFELFIIKKGILKKSTFIKETLIYLAEIEDGWESTRKAGFTSRLKSIGSLTGPQEEPTADQ